MLLNQEVNIIEKKKFLDEIHPQEYYDKSVDDYYLFNVFDCVKEINYIQTITNGSENTYCIGVSKNDLLNILNWLNDTFNLDPLDRATVEAKVFGSIIESTIDVETIDFKIIVKDNNLSEIKIASRGMINTKYEGSKDFDNIKTGEYDFLLTIKVTDKGNNFELFETAKDAK